MNYKLNL